MVCHAGAPVAAVVHEGAVFAGCDQARGQAEGLQIDLVARRFVVEGETFAVMSDLAQPARVVVPAHRTRRRAGGARFARVGRAQRIVPEGVQDVCEYEFLVLLLVVDAEFGQRFQVR
jgi:hypothetical protein